ncbi:MAG: hypothetical protein ACI8PZ_007083 [Myxococcota bacterium]|jgi:hypothetical protein
MTTLPSNTLILHDPTGAAFGCIRFAPSDDRPGTGECLFDISEAARLDPARPSEVRWLAHRHYVRWSEHTFEVDDEGAVTIRKGSFTIVLDPTEAGGVQTRPPAPFVRGSWER